MIQMKEQLINVTMIVKHVMVVQMILQKDV